MNECTFGVTPKPKIEMKTEQFFYKKTLHDCLGIKSGIERRRQLNGIRGSGHDSHEKKIIFSCTYRCISKKNQTPSLVHTSAPRHTGDYLQTRKSMTRICSLSTLLCGLCGNSNTTTLIKHSLNVQSSSLQIDLNSNSLDPLTSVYGS